MNSNQINGQVRTVLGVFLGYATAKGWISAGMANEIVGLGGALIVAAWSWYEKKDA